MAKTAWEARNLSLSQTPRDFMAQVEKETRALEGIAWVGRCSTVKQSARSYKALAEQGALSYSANRLTEAYLALRSWMETSEFEHFPTVSQTLKTSTLGSVLIMEWNEWAKATAFAAYRWMSKAPLTDEELEQLQMFASQLTQPINPSPSCQ